MAWQMLSQTNAAAMPRSLSVLIAAALLFELLRRFVIPFAASPMPLSESFCVLSASSLIIASCNNCRLNNDFTIMNSSLLAFVVPLRSNFAQKQKVHPLSFVCARLACPWLRSGTVKGLLWRLDCNVPSLCVLRNVVALQSTPAMGRSLLHSVVPPSFRLLQAR